jgi:hypothetical protein
MKQSHRAENTMGLPLSKTFEHGAQRPNQSSWNYLRNSTARSGKFVPL